MQVEKSIVLTGRWGRGKLYLKHGFYVFSDEVYQDFVYQGEHISIGHFMGDSDLFLHVGSFSKSYAMTGWRIGYIVAEKAISDALNRIHQYLTVCGVAFAQKGACFVLDHPQRKTYLEEMRKAFIERYSVWRDALLGCPAAVFKLPGGAFYLFPKINYKGMTGGEFCRHMLETHDVAMVPGEVFGSDYHQHVRISYGLDIKTQHKAAERVKRVLCE